MGFVSLDPHNKEMCVCQTDNTSTRANFMEEDSPLLGEELESF